MTFSLLAFRISRLVNYCTPTLCLRSLRYPLPLSTTRRIPRLHRSFVYSTYVNVVVN